MGGIVEQSRGRVDKVLPLYLVKRSCNSSDASKINELLIGGKNNPVSDAQHNVATEVQLNSGVSTKRKLPTEDI
jgi:hypothetical protein